MIEKMTKYSFIMLSSYTEDFLQKLQEIGMMDITRSRKPVDEASAALLDRMKDCKDTAAYLKKADWSKDPDAQDIEKAAASAVLPETDPVAYVKEQKERLEDLRNSINSAKSRIREYAPWGEFDRTSLDRISEAGYELHYFSAPVKAYKEEWGQEYPIEVISRDSKNVWFVAVTPQNGTVPLPAKEIPAPAYSASEARAHLKELEAQTATVKGNIIKAKDFIGRLETEYKETADKLDLYLADAASSLAAENTVTLLVGFAPSKDDEKISAELDKLDAYWFKDAATKEDNPPIKLRNNRFTRQFEVLTGMYGMPVYDEFDPTPILAPFFLLFFSLCLGDAGYGIILILISLLLRFKMPDSSFGKMWTLVLTLGAGTIVTGTLLGSFFGVSLYEASWVPEGLKKCMITGDIAGFPAAMVLAIAIGVIHTCLAMTVKAICYTVRFGIKTTISNWGWLLLIIGVLVLGGLGLIGALSSQVTQIAVIVIGIISGLAIYVFNTPGRNPLINIGSGLWDTYNMATGLISDVLSYLRLYALGLAGGMLGTAFNTIGGIIFEGCTIPVLNWIFFILILMLGHTLNLAMSCLGAFVHPLRLTFLEYFKNSGYEGTGRAYKPLVADNKK